MTPLVRLPLALAVIALALMVDFVATVGGRTRLFGIPLGRERDEREERFQRSARVLHGVLAVTSLGLLAFHPWPGGTFGALLGYVSASSMFLAAAQHRARKRLGDADVPGPRVVHLHGRVRLGELLSAPLQLFNAGVVIAGVLFFRWLTPYLPSVARLHWQELGGDGFGEPRRLWWSLAIIAFNTTVMLFVAWGISREPWARSGDERDALHRLIVQRRALLVRLTEVIMVGLDVAAVIAWIGAALALVPGQRPGIAGQAAMGAALVGGLAFTYALARFTPPLVRIRARLRTLGTPTPGADPAGYRLGGFLYFAPADRSIFVPKKQGIGSTLNFARPSAWLFLALLVLVPLAFALAMAL